jgi:replicative superfamily II helicase
MSATLPNMSDLSKWLNASLYITTYRPVQLAVRVCCDRKLYEIKEASAGDAGEMTFRLDRAVPSLSTLLLPYSICAPPLAFLDTQPPPPSSARQQQSFGGIADEDSDGFISLVLETLLSDKSVMVFCNSKRRCELCVERISKIIYATESQQKQQQQQQQQQPRNSKFIAPNGK